MLWRIPCVEIGVSTCMRARMFKEASCRSFLPSPTSTTSGTRRVGSCATPRPATQAPSSACAPSRHGSPLRPRNSPSPVSTGGGAGTPSVTTSKRSPRSPSAGSRLQPWTTNPRPASQAASGVAKATSCSEGANWQRRPPQRSAGRPLAARRLATRRGHGCVDASVCPRLGRVERERVERGFVPLQAILPKPALLGIGRDMRSWRKHCWGQRAEGELEWRTPLVLKQAIPTTRRTSPVRTCATRRRGRCGGVDGGSKAAIRPAIGAYEGPERRLERI